MSLTFERVHKRFPGGTVALEGLSLEVPRGEFVSLIGPSGCGKTTLLRIAAGLEGYQEGRVTHAGQVVREDASWRRAVIYQDIRLFPWMSVRENLLFGLRSRGLEEREATDRAAVWMERLGVVEYADRYPGEISAGMAQKASVCRVLAQGPDLILCDEPFTNLDWVSREFLQEQLLRYWAEQRPTVVFVTHSVEEAVYLAQRVVVMTARPGRIKADLTVNVPGERWQVARNHPDVLNLARHVAGEIADEVDRALSIELQTGT